MHAFKEEEDGADDENDDEDEKEDEEEEEEEKAQTDKNKGGRGTALVGFLRQQGGHRIDHSLLRGAQPLPFGPSHFPQQGVPDVFLANARRAVEVGSRQGTCSHFLKQQK